MSTVTKYILFAIIATATNIGSQDLLTHFYSGAFSVTLSILIGTGTGLITKYLLDKKYIFAYQTQSLKHDSQVLAKYTTTGIATTLIFWGMEFGFDYLFASKEMRYLGGIIGLAIGYAVKYRLDRRFVFGLDTKTIQPETNKAA